MSKLDNSKGSSSEAILLTSSANLTAQSANIRNDRVNEFQTNLETRQNLELTEHALEPQHVSQSEHALQLQHSLQSQHSLYSQHVLQYQHSEEAELIHHDNTRHPEHHTKPPKHHHKPEPEHKLSHREAKELKQLRKAEEKHQKHHQPQPQLHPQPQKLFPIPPFSISPQPQPQPQPKPLTTPNLIQIFELHRSKLSDPSTSSLTFQTLSSELHIEPTILTNKYKEYLQREVENKLQTQTLIFTPSLEPKIEEIIDEAIKVAVAKTPFLALRDLRRAINETNDLNIAKETLERRLRALGYKYQRYTIKNVGKDTPIELTARCNYSETLRTISYTHHIVYFGECTFALDEFLGEMWLKINKNGQVEFYHDPKEVVTIMMMISREKVEFSLAFIGESTEEHFLSAVAMWRSKMGYNFHDKPAKNEGGFSEPCLIMERKVYTSTTMTNMTNSSKMDNTMSIPVQSIPTPTSTHIKTEFNSNTEVHTTNNSNIESIEESKSNLLLSSAQQPPSQSSNTELPIQITMDNDLKILYIPSFSPQLNPTEIIFNMMKYDTRREKPRNLEQLKSMLEHCVGKIDKNDMLFIFEDLDGCIRRAEDKREIN